MSIQIHGKFLLGRLFLSSVHSQKYDREWPCKIYCMLHKLELMPNDHLKVKKGLDMYFTRPFPVSPQLVKQKSRLQPWTWWKNMKKLCATYQYFAQKTFQTKKVFFRFYPFCTSNDLTFDLWPWPLSKKRSLIPSEVKVIGQHSGYYPNKKGTFRKIT